MGKCFKKGLLQVNLGKKDVEKIAKAAHEISRLEHEADLAKNDPGEGRLPGIEEFSCPKGFETEIFRTLYFHTDKDTLEGKNYYQIIDQISQYLKKNPQLFIFVEGHCDDRGPEQYNLSLGARRGLFLFF